MCSAQSHPLTPEIPIQTWSFSSLLFSFTKWGFLLPQQSLLLCPGIEFPCLSMINSPFPSWSSPSLLAFHLQLRAFPAASKTTSPSNCSCSFYRFSNKLHLLDLLPLIQSRFCPGKTVWRKDALSWLASTLGPSKVWWWLHLTQWWRLPGPSWVPWLMSTFPLPPSYVYCSYPNPASSCSL